MSSKPYLQDLFTHNSQHIAKGQKIKRASSIYQLPQYIKPKETALRTTAAALTSALTLIAP
jgi:hypothetical protein